MTKQFNFYKTYADVIGEFTNTEAGSFIKKLCKCMFLNEELKEDAKDKVTSILILLSATLLDEKNGTYPTRSKGKYFTFKSVYANIFYSLNRRNGYNVVTSSNNLEEAKRKFIEKLYTADQIKKQQAIQAITTPTEINGIPATFDGFANYYFETFYKRKVCNESYRKGNTAKLFPKTKKGSYFKLLLVLPISLCLP